MHGFVIIFGIILSNCSEANASKFTENLKNEMFPRYYIHSDLYNRC